MTTEQLVADVLELAAIPAPTFAEEARLDWLDDRLTSAPGQRSRDAAGNLVWQWGDGRPELAILAHVDTVFPAETPLSFRREDGRLIGPGIGDNAAAVVVALHAVSVFLGEQPSPPRSFGLHGRRGGSREPARSRRCLRGPPTRRGRGR